MQRADRAASSCRPTASPASGRTHAQKAQGRWLEQGDVEEALNAAAQIGDDTIQRKPQGTVVPESFTHGTSAQRVTWFKRGLQTGSVAQCNTFEARQALGEQTPRGLCEPRLVCQCRAEIQSQRRMRAR